MRCACGNFLDETVDTTPNRWIAEAVTCQACAARERMQSNGKTGHGVKYRTIDQSRR